MTAVEFFAEELNKWRTKEFGEEAMIGIPIEVLEEANKLFEEQIISAHKTATLEAGFEHSADDWANQYYNQTFKSTADESQTDRTIQS